MKTFNFSFNGKTFAVKAENAVAAMEKANREFLDKLDKNPYPGAWHGETDFCWIEGNFFD